MTYFTQINYEFFSKKKCQYNSWLNNSKHSGNSLKNKFLNLEKGEFFVGSTQYNVKQKVAMATINARGNQKYIGSIKKFILIYFKIKY